MRIVIGLIFYISLMSHTCFAQNLEAYWSFDEELTAEGSSLEYFHNGRDAELDGQASYSNDTVTGVGHSLDCSALQAHAAVAKFPGILAANARSMVMWVKLPNAQTGQARALLGYGDAKRGPGAAFSLMARKLVNGWALEVRGPGMLQTNVTALESLQWHHVAVVAPRFATSQKTPSQVRLYVDGERVATAKSEPVTFNTLGTLPFTICRAHAGSGVPDLQGKIDDIAIFGGELSESSIKGLAQSKLKPNDLIMRTVSSQKLYDNHNLQLWKEDSSVKVFEDSPAPLSQTAAPKIRLSAAGREHENVQVALKTVTDLSDVHWEFTDLKDSSGRMIPKTNFLLRKVAYVPVPKPSLENFHRGMHPDPLSPMKPYKKVGDGILLKSNVTHTFWLDVYVPEGSKAGVYFATTRILSANSVLAEFDIELKVRSFALPKHPSLYTAASLHNPYMLDMDKIEVLRFEKGNKFEILERYYKNLIDHRVTHYTHARLRPDIDVFVDEDDKVQLVDRDFYLMLTILREYGLERFTFPAVPLIAQHKLKAPAMWLFGDRKQNIFTDDQNLEFDQEFLDLFYKTYRPIVKSLEAHGVLENAVLSLIDEPNYSDPPTLNALVKLFRLFKDLDKRIKTRITSAPLPKLYDLVNIWELNANQTDQSIARIRDRQAKGDEVGFYNNLLPLIDFASIRLRSQGWTLWQYQLQGSLSWFRITGWEFGFSPWLYPAGSGGTGYYGAAKLLYPPQNDSYSGPVDSIRWELLRKGQEDYEYIKLLADKMKAKGGEIATDVKTRADLDRLVEQVSYGIPRQFNKDVPRTYLDQPYTPDAMLLQNIREKIADAIEAALAQ